MGIVAYHTTPTGAPTMSSDSFYFKTFARLALLPYIGGTVVHILRLIYNFSIDEMPFDLNARNPPKT